MENKIESNNSIGATNKNILIPSGSQLLLYFLMAVVLLVALNIKNAWDYLNKTVLIPEGGIDSIITTHAPSLHKILNSISQSIILQVVFWVFVGCGVYRRKLIVCNRTYLYRRSLNTYCHEFLAANV
jgi:hypothetical protein